MKTETAKKAHTFTIYLLLVLLICSIFSFRLEPIYKYILSATVLITVGISIFLWIKIKKGEAKKNEKD